MSFRSSRTIVPSYTCRRLRFEALERRDLLAVMRVVSWNTFNGPNDAAANLNFKTVLEAIGNETVQGNTQRIDILAVQETDSMGTVNSIAQIASILNTSYPSANYEYIVTTEPGGDATGFVFDSTSVELLDSDALTTSLTHPVMRAQFQPVGTTTEFYVYSVHLKSGDTGADATTRGNEAAVLRANADALAEGAHVIMVGDFNMKTFEETAWGNLVTDFGPGQPGQLHDVADAPGDWFNNPAFKSLHSQDSRVAMDDRFDIQFASGEFLDGIGLEYVANSYHVFGNNGTHTFDGSITTGFWPGTDLAHKNTTVLNALVAASDHLPVIADYQFVLSTPRVRITQTLGGTTVAEGGPYDTYHVVLDTVPAANVSVTVTPNAQIDVGNGAGVAKVLTFTPANAFTPQTVLVNAANDAIDEGYHSGSIAHSSASSDMSYNGLTINGVSVSIADNDPVRWVINELDADTPDTDTMEFVELYDGGVGNVSLAGMTLVFFNGSTDTAYAVFNLAGYFTDTDGFFLLGNSGVSGVDITFANDTLQQGTDAVALYSGTFSVGGAVTTTNLIDAVVYETGDPNDAGLLVLLDHVGGTQSQVDEAQGGTSTTKSIARVPDGGAQRKTATFAVQAPTPNTYNVPHAYGVEFLQSAARIDIEEGGATDTYQIALVHLPSADVTITIDPDNQTDLGLGAGVARILTFTPTNGLTPQTVTVTAVNDVAIEGVHISTITHALVSGDSRYNGLTVANVVANIVDNDVPIPPSIAISEIMYDPASTQGSNEAEWIEIVNTGTNAVDLGGWKFDDEDATNWGTIPANTILNPHQAAVFFNSSFTSAATFRSEWSVPSGALVVGITWGNLANAPGTNEETNDEIIQLLDNVGTQIDVVDYGEGSTWPTGASSPGGPSFYLKGLSLDNNNGANWAKSVVGTASALSPSGPTFSTSDVGSPGRFFLTADYSLNASVDGADYVLWRKSNINGAPGYTDWRTHYGEMGVLASGAAATSFGGASSPSAAAAATAIEVAPATPKSNESAEAAAVDEAVMDLILAPSITTFSPSTTRKSQVESSVGSSSSPDLLLLDLALSSAQSTSGAFDVAAGSSDQYLDDVDELFESLDDAQLIADLEFVATLL